MGYTINCKEFVLTVIANLTNKNKKLNLNGKDVLYSNFEDTNNLKPYQVVILKETRK